MKSVLRLAIVSVATLGFTACQSRPSPSAQFTAADEAAIRAVLDSALKNVNERDWTSWAGLFADSAVMQPPNAKALHGRQAILAFGQAFPPIERFSAWDVQIRGEGNLAYVTSAVEIKLKGGAPDTSKQLVVFRRSPAGRWEGVALSVNSDLPLAPASPAAARKK
jgi:ketosteroid isomerase-like protein